MAKKCALCALSCLLGAIGKAEFIAGLEQLLGRKIARRAPGRKPAASVTAEHLELPQ